MTINDKSMLSDEEAQRKTVGNIFNLAINDMVWLFSDEDEKTKSEVKEFAGWMTEVSKTWQECLKDNNRDMKGELQRALLISDGCSLMNEQQEKYLAALIDIAVPFNLHENELFAYTLGAALFHAAGEQYALEYSEGHANMARYGSNKSQAALIGFLRHENKSILSAQGLLIRFSQHELELSPHLHAELKRREPELVEQKAMLSKCAARAKQRQASTLGNGSA